VLADVSPTALTLLLPLAPSLIATDPLDSVVSVTVTVLLPAARLIVPNLLTPPRLTVPALLRPRVFDWEPGHRLALNLPDGGQDREASKLHPSHMLQAPRSSDFNEAARSSEPCHQL
jgi:hypothetical protein